MPKKTSKSNQRQSTRSIATERPDSPTVTQVDVLNAYLRRSALLMPPRPEAIPFPPELQSLLKLRPLFVPPFPGIPRPSLKTSCPAPLADHESSPVSGFLNFLGSAMRVTENGVLIRNDTIDGVAPNGHAQLPPPLFSGWWDHEFVMDKEGEMTIELLLEWNLDIDQLGFYDLFPHENIMCAFGWRLDAFFGKASVDADAIHFWRRQNSEPVTISPITPLAHRELGSMAIASTSNVVSTCLPLAKQELVEHSNMSNQFVLGMLTTIRLWAAGGARAALHLSRYGVANPKNVVQDRMAAQNVVMACKRLPFTELPPPEAVPVLSLLPPQNFVMTDALGEAAHDGYFYFRWDTVAPFTDTWLVYEINIKAQSGCLGFGDKVDRVTGIVGVGIEQTFTWRQPWPASNVCVGSTYAYRARTIAMNLAGEVGASEWTSWQTYTIMRA